MNSSEEEKYLSTSFTPTAERLQKKITMDARREEEMKQEILNVIRVEITKAIKQNKIDIKSEIASLLGPDIDTLKKNILEIKSNTVTRDEMNGEMNKFFDKFLNEFSHAVEDIKDPETKKAFGGLIKRTKDAFKEG